MEVANPHSIHRRGGWRALSTQHMGGCQPVVHGDDPWPSCCPGSPVTPACNATAFLGPRRVLNGTKGKPMFLSRTLYFWGVIFGVPSSSNWSGPSLGSLETTNNRFAFLGAGSSMAGNV